MGNLFARLCFFQSRPSCPKNGDSPAVPKESLRYCLKTTNTWMTSRRTCHEPVTGHTGTATDLPYHHRDLFDRLIIAQSLVEKIPVVSSDELFARYGVERIW